MLEWMQVEFIMPGSGAGRSQDRRIYSATLAMVSERRQSPRFANLSVSRSGGHLKIKETSWS